MRFLTQLMLLCVGIITLSGCVADRAYYTQVTPVPHYYHNSYYTTQTPLPPRPRPHPRPRPYYTDVSPVAPSHYETSQTPPAPPSDGYSTSQSPPAPAPSTSTAFSSSVSPTPPPSDNGYTTDSSPSVSPSPSDGGYTTLQSG